MAVGVIAQRTLNFRAEIGEHRLHRVEYLPGVFAHRSAAFELLGFFKWQLERL